MKIKVIFRKFLNGEIIALFPEEINYHNNMVGSYMHIGQHGDADYKGIITDTQPATNGEYNDLLRELESIGYDLQII